MITDLPQLLYYTASNGSFIYPLMWFLLYALNIKGDSLLSFNDVVPENFI